MAHWGYRGKILFAKQKETVIVQLLSCVQLFVTPWTAACQTSLSFTITWSLLKFMSIELVVQANHLILCCPLLLLPSTFPSIRVFSSESDLCIRWPKYWSFQFSSVVQSCLILCDPMNCSTPGPLVYHQFPEFTQTHVHWIREAIQPLYPLPSPSPSAFNLSQHQGLFQWVGFPHQLAKVLELQFQHQSF